jgi:type IV secretory pathway VirB4 component
VSIESLVLWFEEEIQRTQGLLKETCEETCWLEDEDVLTYLHSTVSWKTHKITMPEPACYLDTYLTDTDLERVWQLPHLCRWPMLGDRYLRCVSAKVYPKKTMPGMLDILDALPIEYRACIRALPIAKQKAISEARKYGDSHYGKRTRTGGSTARVERIALDYSDEASTFQAGIEHGTFGAGGLTQTVVVWDTDFAQATEKARLVEHTLNAEGYTAKLEGVNTLAAWDATLPGNRYRNVRRPLLTTRNLAHLLPVTSVWRGTSWNTHLQAPALLRVTGRGTTPFDLDTYEGDTGHFEIVGPTGAGKSTLANLMALYWQRYPAAQVYVFEMGESFRCLTYAVGGQWFDVGAELAEVFQGSGHLDDAAFQPWAHAWRPPHGRFQCFELGSLMTTPTLVSGVVKAIADSIQQQQTGAPTMVIYDEAWKYVKPLAGVDIDAYAFSHRIEEDLRTARKLNTCIGFSTQSLAEMQKSPLAAVLQESCKTKIFLANPEALTPEIGQLYAGYGLNARQQQIIASLVPKRQYYVKHSRGHQVIDLELGPLALAFVGSGSKPDLARMAEMYTSDPGAFAWQWLHAKGLHTDAEELRQAMQGGDA